MRFVALVFAMLFAAGPAAAQTWREFSYPDQSFAVSFPAPPQVETATYLAADNRGVNARVYTVRQSNAVLSVTVADLGQAGLEETAVLDHAIKKLSEGGEVKVDIPHRINRVYGRQFSVLWPDGSRALGAVFDYNGHLYQIEGKTLPNASDIADIIRFQQSLIFTGGGSNRSSDAIRAIREACRGSAANGPPNPAGADDPRCRRRAR
jgi:hypothetical protein